MTSPYVQNERVLCYHGPLIYEAKVLDTEHHDNPAPITGKVGWHYFVHYKGWKDKCVLWSVHHSSRALMTEFPGGMNGLKNPACLNTARKDCRFRRTC